ncbi:DUF6435 family protein [Aestuariirhabdus sp. Z084]|uniref:DUF6435 family protein n=1 Tax=Aestuariirhabdus haliotis TaxID=2918751 RepID=UPI0020C0C317|nr:DUF6435 family protein [Aestuariirhabdus haliotis]MCL6416686.1 DUF6435 family protein [Aestuariirhabdus haliotis]
MFSLFKQDPTRKLQKMYESTLEKAMFAQRNGDIKAYSSLSVDAAKLAEQIQQIKSEKKI